ncbi:MULTISPECIES: aldehyde ferredoxin oxidoreductase N-terminal domain-containing protein [unclassified Sedimentibacter]|uniref:aldehyde ferredoxin oxidoreductase N-terminal domain-containing protein n=1 Tax=unclassified Sedimentibacter TaxID=2649220 RepID=UPI0027E05A7C|nr:aldehyde ferredoxin oxidoreductase N-terminal domain-containing protein [Sedimentibacter sp. MB35-C1]WMJ78743.1 aldehyde ferredoxin oxidoreductase N-terminal domain-containing protein [Sedimentibacter sp. MB35-C1]
MSRICYVDLTDKSISYEEYNINEIKHHGRGLAAYLTNKHTAPLTDRFDDDNVIVFTVGLFTGTTAPSSGRITLATRKGKGLGLQVMNMTGDFPQKLASAGIECLVIKGKAKDNNTVIYIEKDKVEIRNINADESYVSNIISKIKSSFGNDCAIIGTGPAADVMMPISTLFGTYPEGYPQYYCSRNGFGDIWGSKNLKAVVINNDKYFENKCFDKHKFSIESKKLSRIIIDNPICGQALPGNGSITLIKLLKNKNNIPEVKESAASSGVKTNKSSYKKINKTCSPLCVVGCLNRHCRNNEEAFSAPAESEVSAALQHCYDMEDISFAKKINTKAFELGIDSTEFVFSTNIYFKATNMKPSKSEIYNLLHEIEENSILGKIIGSKTIGIYNLYKENPALKLLVTKPVISEEKKFNISVDKFFEEFKDVDDLELMYRQIFLLENMGFCIFTSFALINNKEALNIIADMFYYKTGIKKTAVEMLNYSGECITREIENERNNAMQSIQKNIPEFTKVLYRYFS